MCGSQHTPWGAQAFNALTPPGNETQVSPVLGFCSFFYSNRDWGVAGGGKGAQLTSSLGGSHRNSEVSPQKKERKRRVEGCQGTPICPEALPSSRSGEGCVKSWGA